MTMGDEAHGGDIELPFDELFFTRTSPSGVIKYGNGVFQRVSGYSWGELLGRPHNIVRHPDMPRAVFWQLWRTLKDGAPVGAYVKNRAKDGRAYWVYAIVTPVEAGHLSVRMKPSSDLFEVTKEEYAALVGRERIGKLPPSESFAILMERLGQLGFYSYSSFMTAALGAEVTARDTALGHAPDAALALFSSLCTATRALVSTSTEMSDASPNHASYTALADNCGVLNHALESAYFLYATARVQRDALIFFKDEDDGLGLPRATEMNRLESQQQEYAHKAREALDELSQRALATEDVLKVFRGDNPVLNQHLETLHATLADLGQALRVAA